MTRSPSNGVMLIDPYGHGIPAAVDPISACLATIDAAHGMIHAGKMFFVDRYVDMTNGQVLDFLFIAPTTADMTEAHLVFEAWFEAEGSIACYEDVVVSANGTAVPSFNRRRSMTTAALAKTYLGPTVTSLGTLLLEKRVGSGKVTGGNVRANMELVLATGRKYLFRFTNPTTSNNLLDYQADWYELASFSM